MTRSNWSDRDPAGRIRHGVSAIAILAALALSASGAAAQTATNLTALQGLAPVTALANTEAGRAALAQNLAITGAIQSGAAKQPLLLPFPKQQQLALRDAFITTYNASQLADGLGSKLGAAYRAAARYTSPDGGKTTSYTNISPAVAELIGYAYATASADSNSGKFYFANATLDGKQPVSAAALAFLKDINGTTDIFGKAYNLLPGTPGADAFGNSRPFQTEPRFTAIVGKDFFGVESSNHVWLRGPKQDLIDSPSYPSGHTTYGYAESLMLAVLVPERYLQMVTRAAEYGNNRIIVGAHYTMDVLGGRTLATHDIAQLLANRAGYVGVKRGNAQIDDFQKALAAARADVTKALEAGCGDTVAICARQDRGRFAIAERNQALHDATQTYGLPVVHAQTAAAAPEDVARLAPEAGHLLTVAFPWLTLAEANAILTATEGPGGGFLDNGSGYGVYSRLDLYRAAQKAIAAAPH